MIRPTCNLPADHEGRDTSDMIPNGPFYSTTTLPLSVPLFPSTLPPITLGGIGHERRKSLRSRNERYREDKGFYDPR